MGPRYGGRAPMKPEGSTEAGTQAEQREAKTTAQNNAP